MAASLGEELSTALTNITSLIVKTKSKSERARLTQLQAALAGQLQLFVDKVVDQALPEYKTATKALNSANALAEAAKADADKVAATIEKVASAVEKIAALAGKLPIA